MTYHNISGRLGQAVTGHWANHYDLTHIDTQTHTAYVTQRTAFVTSRESGLNKKERVARWRREEHRRPEVGTLQQVSIQSLKRPTPPCSLISDVRVKLSLHAPWKAFRGTAPLILNLGNRRSQIHVPGRFTPMTMRLRESKSHSGRSEEEKHILPVQGIESIPQPTSPSPIHYTELHRYSVITKCQRSLPTVFCPSNMHVLFTKHHGFGGTEI